MNAGISRQGMEPPWIAKETAKSNLLLKARLLQEEGETDDAVVLYAQAAEMEEELADYCAHIGLQEKAFIHQFSAASCWAKVGELQRALRLCDALLQETALTAPMQKAVTDYAETLKERRRRWLTFWQGVQNAQEQNLAEPVLHT